ncbi:hypothetical protein R1sor_007918 [Riccia sorocarpa]|uniref:Histone deacetylase interacting domain-containing protein n=1 Tax=Riccia sorocarpa TaxID=122646 RepID=A0ABD3HUQ9_9MARC
MPGYRLLHVLFVKKKRGGDGEDRLLQWLAGPCIFNCSLSRLMKVKESAQRGNSEREICLVGNRDVVIGVLLHLEVVVKGRRSIRRDAKECRGSRYMREVSCVTFEGGGGGRRMKRSREDGASVPQMKRVAGYRGETAATSDASLPTSNSNAPQQQQQHQQQQQQQRLTTDDALAYLKAVKDMFKDDKDKYDEFLEVMKDFKAQRIDTAGVIIRVKDLFKGHRQLILGFNTFLPKGYEITITEEEAPKKQPVEFDQAINYVNKIKTRFSADEHVYKAFLEILNMYRKGNKSISEVYQEVATLFSEHGDLLEEFTYFLPDSSGTHVGPLKPATNTNNIRNSTAAVDKSSGLTQSRQGQAERVVKREKIVSYGERDRGSDRHGDGATERLQSKIEKEQKELQQQQRKKSEKKEDFDRREKEKEKAAAKDVEEGKERDLDASQRLPHKRKSARRADELIRKQSQAAEGGETLQGSASPLVDEEKKPLKSSSLSKEHMIFFEKVKTRLRNRDLYQEFLKCINIFSQEIITKAELMSLVGDILGKHSDLMDGFTEFLSRRENLEGYLAGVLNKQKLEFGEGALLKPPKVEKDKERERDRKERADGDAPTETEHENNREKDRDRSGYMGLKDPSCQKASSIFNKDKYSNKPISELDLSNCERCTPSYRLLPKSYPKPVSSHRTELARGVLNDSWVSVTSGSEDYSFKHMRKNQYEESLFRCEDDRFELDMLLESTNVTARRVAELLENLQDPSFSKLAHVEDHLSAINLRCIERIYGDHGLDVIDLVKKNTSNALPVILNRLKQKHEDWLRCRTDMNKVWAEVYAKNYHKSLDHRSFYFKQQDKKSLSTKALITEIKELSEKKRREDDSAVAVASGNRRPLIPDLKFSYPDPSVHEDVFKIIKYSLDEVCNTVEQSQKILRMWTDVIEPFFDVARRAQGAEERADAGGSKTQPSTNKGGSADGGEVSGSYGDAREPDKASSLHDAKTGEVEGSAASANPNSKSAPSFSLPPPKAGPPQPAEESTEPSTVRRATTGEEMESGPAEKATEAAKGNHRSRAPLVITKNSSGGHLEISTRGDREEGELSPSPDLEDRGAPQFMNHSAYPEKYKRRDGPDAAVMSKPSCTQVDAEESEGNDQDGEGDADDEGEESASENLSEDADLSGNESHDADDGSQDDHEDEDDDEDAEREGKAESEGEADGDGGDNDGDRDRMSSPPSQDMAYSDCPPLAAYLDAEETQRLGSQSSNIFYGNDGAYVIFRLHQTLYERILCAKTNAIAAEKKWKSIKDTAPPNLYAKFLKVLFSLLDGSLDNAKFEDECRTIIGTQSYILFTLDKLIFKLVKQLQAAVSDDVLQKLLVLHSYEMSRASGHFIDHVYFANASVLLHDENIYRFEYNKKSTECLMQIMDGGFDKHDIPANALESSFSTYLNNFLHIPIEDRNQQHRRIFLARNKRKMLGADDECVALQKKLAGNAVVVNGLEYKISCNTSKVSYVLDTEDYFHRRVQRTAEQQASKRNSREADLEAEKDRLRRSRFYKLFEESPVTVQEK